MTWITTAARVANNTSPHSRPYVILRREARTSHPSISRGVSQLQKEGTGFGITLTIIAVVLTIAAIWYSLTR